MAFETPPTISAVLINYNHADYLPHALSAALEQTVPFDEIIIIDDGSTDGSVSLIEQRIQEFPTAKLLRNPTNLGIVPTLNMGLKAATGDFIYYMSSDDRYSNRISEWCREALALYPDVGMVSGNIRIHFSDTGKEQPFTLPFPQRIARYDRADIGAVAKRRAFTFYGGGNLIRREAIIQGGGLVAALKWHADWFLYLLMASRHPFAVVPQEFMCIRQENNQYSHACHQWPQQKPVIATLIHTLQRDYPNDYGFFRGNAMLPTYMPRIILLLLWDKTLRPYLTPLLAWRLLSYKPMRMIGKLFPDAMRARIRTLLRV